MAAENYKFKNVNELSEALVSDQLESALQAWLSWGLLSVGGFSNVATGTANPYGGPPFSTLKVVNDPRFSAGRVWQGPRSQWVWESGLSYHHQPVAISGVSVNGNFIPSSSTGSFAHSVRYP